MRVTFSKSHKARDERGATLLVVAAMVVCLLAAAGIGIDTSTMAYQRSRVQHGADAGALAVAQSCKAGACDSSLAAKFLSPNASGGGSDNAPSVQLSSHKVTVTNTKHVNTIFFGLLGIGTKDETATSTASWGSYTSGNVKPFLVSLCEYTKVAPNVTTFLDADSSDEIFAYKASDRQQVLLDDNNLTSNCGTIPSGVDISGLDGSARMVVGGLWKTTNGGVNGSVNNNKSVLHIGDTFELGAAQTQNTGGYIDPGLVLFAIYAPTSNFKFGGAQTQSGTDANSKFSQNHPIFDFKIVGFAPFNVAAVRLGKANNNLAGSCPISSCVGIGVWGSFVNELSPDGLDYSTGGPNIGSVVKLID